MGRHGGCEKSRVALWVALFAILCIWALPLCEAGGFPDLDDLKDDLQDLDREDIASAVARLADMPLFAQKTLLRVLGASLVDLDELPCNIFGGAWACQYLPPDSHLAQACTDVNMQVDCAFRAEVMQQAGADPDTVLRERMSALGHKPCESCYESLQRFWCAQAVPKCGTFDKIVDKLLPVLSRVVKDEERPEDALGEALPDILQSLSMGLPCREMCDAVTETCGCGDPETFGEVLTSVYDEADQALETSAMSASMSYDTAQQLFKGIWDVPICELFAQESTPGFHGECYIPSGSLETCDWCMGQRPQVQLVWQQMVAQISQSISSMMGAGLERLLSQGKQKPEWEWQGGGNSAERSHDDNNDDDNDDNNDEEDNAKKGHTNAGWILFWITFSAIGLAGLGYAGFYVYEKRYNFRRRYVDLGDIGEDEDDKYTPPEL